MSKPFFYIYRFVLAVYIMGSYQPIWAMSCPDLLSGRSQVSLRSHILREDNEENVFAVHITKFLPSDGYVRAVTKDRGRFSPTLHFSLGEPVVDHPWGNWSAKSYAVVTPLKSLRDQLLNLYPQDTFILGDFKIPPEAVLFIPKEELPPQNLNCRIIQYDSALGIKAAITRFLMSSGSIQFKAEGMMSHKVMVAGKDILEEDNLEKFFPKLFADKPYLTRTSHDYTIIDYLANWMARKDISKSLNMDIQLMIHVLKDRLIEIRRVVDQMQLSNFVLDSYERGLKELESYFNIFEVEQALRVRRHSLLAFQPQSDAALFSKFMSLRHDKRMLLDLAMSVQARLPAAPSDVSLSTPRDYEQWLKYTSIEDFSKILSANFRDGDIETHRQIQVAIARKTLRDLIEGRIKAERAYSYFRGNAEPLSKNDIMLSFGNPLYAVAGNNFPNLIMPPVEMIRFLKHPWVHQFLLSRGCFKYFSPELMENYLKRVNSV